MPELWTRAEIVAQLVKPLETGALLPVAWSSATVSFSFSTAVSADSAGSLESETFSPFNAQQKAAARLALAAVADVIDLGFVEVTGGQGNLGDIRFANFLGEMNSASAWYPGPGIWGDVFISVTPPDPGVPDLSRPVRGEHAFLTYLHEIGHAMGLGHAGDYNSSSPSWAVDALFAQDTEQYTVMSYFQSQDYANGNDHYDPQGVHHFAQTLMLYDIAALQSIYGANLSARSGATVYGFNSTLGIESPYNFAGNAWPVLCIYDAGGYDRIDFSGFTGATLIDLRQGRFSDTEEMAQNVSIAFGTVIEAATGGQGADRIFGNGGANTLRGGGGNDVVSGLDGADRLIGGTGRDVLAGGADNDTLTGGAGSDLFVFGQRQGEVDMVTDFAAGVDRIRLLADAFPEIGLWAQGAFRADAAGRARDQSDRILYDTDSGRLFFDADGNLAGGKAAVLIAQFSTLPGLGWQDFSLV